MGSVVRSAAPRRKADEVARDLLQRIVSGAIEPGALLPRESDLADRYGVNRSVVREANKLLEVHRLVRPTRHKGTVVLDPLCSATPAVLSAMLVDARGRIDRETLREFLEIRATIDVKVTELAAERRSQADLMALTRAAARIEAADPGAEESFEAMNAFGLALARASKNRIFVMLSHWHAQISAELEPLLTRVRGPVARQGGHRLLVEAIARRDVSLAGSLVAEFHRWANQEILAAARELATSRRKRKQESGT
jgi:GntR family transcriptional regulator, transcriptional repressor for pyruvate dehydrogenase complex